MKNLKCPKCFRFIKNPINKRSINREAACDCDYCNIYLFFMNEKITRIGFVGTYLWIDIWYNCKPTMRIFNNNIVLYLSEPIKDYFQVYKILEKYKDNIIFE